MPTAPALLVNFDPPTWVAAFQAHAPTLTVCTPDDMGDPERVDSLLTWHLQPDLIERLPGLRLLCAVGAGVDYLVYTAQRRPELQIVRIVDEAVSGDVATLAVAATLQWLRDLRPYAQQQAQGLWQPRPHRSSAQTTVAILGLGHIGCAAARAFQALGFRVHGWSRTPKSLSGISTHAGADGLRALLPQAQVLVCALPLTPQTTGIVDQALLAQLPTGAYLVNVGRGAHVDESALLSALDSGRLAGAFLDVVTTEPLPNGHPLWRHPAVQLTPHVASRTQPALVVPQIVENLRRLRQGEPLMNRIDPAAGY
ncbi:2-hydroxyacid dehydrogenase [Hydrogenophaga sp. OTU3427]|uniref:2-hydroxyacid dehydrogenase n=1 Tax=Hydrogenophaga sp. OTU3427 TaxID=3043856 RepID=UPI00313B1FE5